MKIRGEISRKIYEGNIEILPQGGHGERLSLGRRKIPNNNNYLEFFVRKMRFSGHYRRQIVNGLLA